MNTQNALVSARSLGRTYGSPPAQVKALTEVDLDIWPGQMLAIMGPSGSGKSTLLTIIGGLEAPSEGSVEFNGHDLWSLTPTELAIVRRREIGYVFQDLNLLSGLTAAENVSAPLELDGVSATSARAQALEGLDRVGLVDRAGAFPDDLSGGERQRVAIARSVVGERRLVLADEPTGALDVATGQEILGLLREACTPDSAVVVVTHDHDVAARADRTVGVRDGRVVSDTSNPLGSMEDSTTTTRRVS